MVKDSDSRIITNDSATDKSRLGYVRVSSVDQNYSAQLAELEALGLYKIFVEKISAKDTKRPQLQAMLEYTRDGDSIYIRDFSRIARSTKDLLELIDNLTSRRVKLISLKEALDTSTDTGKLIVTIIGAINEFERSNILERQRLGIALAVQEGKYKGRKEIKKPDNWAEVYALYRVRELTAKKAMEELRLKRSTFFKFVNEEKVASADKTTQLP